MPDYIRSNSKRCINTKKCSCIKFQSYNAANFGKAVNTCTPISCLVQNNCKKNQLKYQQFVLDQQNLYATMRRFPEKFPIISWVKQMNLTPGEQRAYSNLWYRQFGTSNSICTNNNIWSATYLPGSETPYTN
jgi:hypothetical protein